MAQRKSDCNAGAAGDMGSSPGSGRAPGGGHEPLPVFLPGESQGQRSLAGYTEGHKELDVIE